ncbi:PREDICTED: ectonucleotide pyrophosphatase/phosphodiesterase family member 7 [Tinamus guttatus]|uniref:ectonucleotide pyrophosphatase/phosphodiesterase family member 7 n=1 Tax=Tinamus guttatus TaxID=94827 RepID=UPI00052E6CD8|nr:PREDICTED: ectonucleotide pyrophosphatase/phosphodiesterase family member 7 [Tinamus guttatus]
MFPSLGFLLAALSVARCAPVQQAAGRNKLLLVSFDGFRWNYDQDVDTPNLDAMAAAGGKAQYMTPAFPTITSPCHFTLLTGKYIENHGVIHNMWFNTSTGQKLPYYHTQGWAVHGAELPILSTAASGSWISGLKTGSIYFPGGKATYQGEEVNMKMVEPLLFNYSNENNWRENIDTVMEWFTVNNLDFIALYFGEPDSTGHKYGPESTQRKAMVSQVDRTVGYLRKRIAESGLESTLNLVITSDHGMDTVIKTNEIHLRTVENFTFSDIQFELLDYGPNGLLVPKEGKLEHVYTVLKNAHPKLHVYKKEEFPKRFHYANNSRITPLLMYSDPGYVIHGIQAPLSFLPRGCPWCWELLPSWVAGGEYTNPGSAQPPSSRQLYKKYVQRRGRTHLRQTPYHRLTEVCRDPLQHISKLLIRFPPEFLRRLPRARRRIAREADTDLHRDLDEAIP